MVFATDGTISSWNELIAKQSKYDGTHAEWIFRGQSEDWPLATSLDRTCKLFGLDEGDSMVTLERQIITDFKRHYSKYAPGAGPRNSDTQHWLSLMRHYGAPTRLLDFTFSFFVAVYFALEEARGNSILWAVNKSWLTDHACCVMKDIGGNELLKAWQSRKGLAFDRVFFEPRPPKRFVCAANPYRLHERAAEQQALSLCAADATTGFEDNLREVEGYDSPENVVKISIAGGDARKEILHKLYRAGTNRSVLFPGLEGFARSLHCKTATYLIIQQMAMNKARVWPTT
jgi:hypothetical protein